MVSCTTEELPGSLFTTVMVKNIPTRFTPLSLVEAIGERGFVLGSFDFLYMPMDFKTKKNCGYCFINFMSYGLASQFAAIMEGEQLRAATSEKCLHIIPSRRQGLKDNMDVFASSELLALHEPPKQAGAYPPPPLFRPLVLYKEELVPLNEKIFNEFITNDLELERRTTDDTLNHDAPSLAALFLPEISLDELSIESISSNIGLDDFNRYMEHHLGILRCDE